MLTFEENLEIFLEGACALDWSGYSARSFMAVNPVIDKQLIISRQKLEQGTYSIHWRTTPTYTYMLVIKTGKDINAIYTEINTGDYNKNIDHLLEQLFSTAQHHAVDKLIITQEVQW